ncbi:uncharacterized protein C2orf72 homolog, partial [Ornithorhynchus anatinus]|uniref:uncharacterized protein C2orf72 homolog n=1 Tax=Ornithorhynchus anatinus TaxID=9258 RepID=UPI0010A85BD2
EEEGGGGQRQLRALLEAAWALGGGERVLLVGELWEREPSRELLRAFGRALFPEGLPGAEAGAEAEGAPGSRVLRCGLLLLLVRAWRLRRAGARRALRHLLRDLRARRQGGPALVGVALLRPEARPDEEDEQVRRLEAGLRSVFGRMTGGPVRVVAYCPARPASLQDVRRAACLALTSALGPRPPADERMRERPGLSDLFSCLPWGPRTRRKGRVTTTSNRQTEDGLPDPEEELALTAVSPNGDCQDGSRGSRA